MGSRGKRAASGAGERAIGRTSFLRKSRPEGDLALRLGRETVRASSLDRVYWPDSGYTKGDLIRYYVRNSRHIIRYLKDRPAILKRYPNGIGGEHFFQHNIETAPDLLKTATFESETGRPVNYAVYTDLASLIYLVNLGTIEQHPWHSRLANPDHPDYVVFDLDPYEALIADILKVALATRDVLKDLKLASYPKTSGSKGIHIYVPLRPRYDYEEVAEFAEQVSFRVADLVPGIATTERRIASRRKGEVYVDWQQNAKGKSAASAYSVRARAGATVSTPLTWREVSRGIEIADFDIETVPLRLEKKGDVWEGMFKDRQSLPRLRREA